MIKFIIPGVLPGLNEYINAERRNKYKAAKIKKQTEHLIILIARSKLRGVAIKPPVTIHYTWVEPNKRRDKDNIAFAKKFIQDSLVKAKILPNDGWEHIEGFTDTFDVDKKNPRVEVEIREAHHEPV